MVNLKLVGGGSGAKSNYKPGSAGTGNVLGPAAPKSYVAGSAGTGNVLGPKSTVPLTPSTNSGGGGGGGYGGGGGGGGAGGVAPMAMAAPVMSEQDYLSGDSAYQAQVAALARALQDFQSDDTAKRSQYTTDFGTTLKNLGYDEGTKHWATDDTNTSAGRAYQNQSNDYAGRGLLQSSLYGSAVDNLMRSLNDQYTGINTAKTNFLSDQDRALSSYKNQNTLDSQQARAEALARRAAGMQLA